MKIISMAKVEVGTIVSLMIGFFVLFLIVEALYGTVNDTVNTLNTTMTCTGGVNVSACESNTPPFTVGAYRTAGNLVVYGWRLLQYVIGLGALVLGAMVIMKKAGKL